MSNERKRVISHGWRGAIAGLIPFKVSEVVYHHQGPVIEINRSLQDRGLAVLIVDIKEPIHTHLPCVVATEDVQRLEIQVGQEVRISSVLPGLRESEADPTDPYWQQGLPIDRLEVLRETKPIEPDIGEAVLAARATALRRGWIIG